MVGIKIIDVKEVDEKLVDRLMTLNFCEKCRKGYGSDNLKKNLHGELLCKECFVHQEKAE